MPYQPNTQVCCNGHVVTIHSQSATTCCGSYALFNPQIQKCCNGTVHNSTSHECCGLNGIFNPVNQLCCNGVAHTVTPNSNTMCCGSEVITSGCEQCSDDVIVQSFDPSTQVCCGGVVRQKLYRYTCCCGTNAFDSSKSSCCNGFVQPKDINDTSNCCRKFVNIYLIASYVVSIFKSVIGNETLKQCLLVKYSQTN